MLNPGTYALADRAITTAINEAQSPIVDLEGMTAVTIQARLAYGSGGTTAKVYVATSLDNGLTWVDVACLAFGPAGGVKVVNVSGLTPKGIRTHLGLNKPIYAKTSSYGHFGRKPGRDGSFSWEKTDLVPALKAAVKAAA